MAPPGTIAELRALVTRPASVARIQRGRSEPVAVEWLIGGVRVGLPGEGWPSDAAGEPLLGLAQLNLTAAPFFPPALAGIAVVTVFLARDGESLAIPDGRGGGNDWAVRAYRKLDGLQTLTPPNLGPAAGRPRRLAWERIDDLPSYEDLLNLVDVDLLEHLLDGDEVEAVLGSAASGTKLGGWPTLVQDELEWDDVGLDGSGEPVFCLQLDSTEGADLTLWDGGVLYIGLRPGGNPMEAAAWVASAQFL